MRRWILLPVLLIASMATLATARADCTCVANGQRYQEGELVCLKLSSGSWLARCGKVLNNTAWKKVQDDCPLSQVDERPASPAPEPLKTAELLPAD